MKKILAIILAVNVCGCAIQMKPDEATQMELKQHSAILQAISVYINDLQVKGVLPKPKEKKE